MGRFSQTAKIERELIAGLDRAVNANEQLATAKARRGTIRKLDKLCRERPETVRETVEELARMRAGWQQISYNKALRQIVDASLKRHGPAIDVGGGI